MSEPVISTTGLSKRYGGVRALDGVDLQIEEGSVYALIGPNGAGKTTAFKILVNLATPSGGRASVMGVDSRRVGAREFEKIGYVSEGQDMPDWMTVDYFLSYLQPFYPTWDDARAMELLRLFNLPTDRKLRDLSRGMKMKARLVSSLAYRPRVLFLDEPFSGLDAAVREDVIEALVESASETTILISSHELADMESFSTHVGYLDGGRLLISEEMASLSARFREVEVTLNTAASVPSQWPKTWLRPQAAASVVRFVETRYDDEKTRADIRRTLGDVLDISINPMPLRSIFVSLARGMRGV